MSTSKLPGVVEETDVEHLPMSTSIPPTVKEEEVVEHPIRPRLTDVVVVVGGQEFHESSHILASWSDYFEGAIHSGMEEAETKRFNFPDMKPEEWELITALGQPYPTKRITNENLFSVLRWYDLLCAKQGLEACDRFFSGWLLQQMFGGNFDFDFVVEHLSTCCEYCLPHSKTECLRALRTKFDNLDVSPEDEDAIVKLFSLLSHDEELRHPLFDDLKPFLPRSIADEDSFTTSVGDKWLPQLVLSTMQWKGAEKRARKAESERMGRPGWDAWGGPESSGDY